MKAAWFEKFGTPGDSLQVGEQPKPEPLEGEVLVRLYTSGINPSDVKKRAGAFSNLLDDGLIIPNSDGAGVIEAVGEGVDASRVGERVWVYQAQYGRRLGTAAQYVSLDSHRAVSLPENAAFETGACMGIPAMTAHRCVFVDGDVLGQSVLITGGVGRVGHYAIQIAALAGAKVIATASNDEDAQSCISAGASAVVNHRQDDWSNDVLEANNGQKVDRVIDVEFGANLDVVLKLIKTSGSIATYSSTQVPQPQLPFVQMMFMDLTIRLVIVYAMPEQAKLSAIDWISDALANDRLQHRVAHVLSLDDIARGNELIERGGFRGCVVLDTR